MRLFPFANAFLHISKLGWCEHRFGFVATVLHESLFEGRRSKRYPEIGLYVVLLYAHTIVISQTEIILSLRKALFGSLLPPTSGLGGILFDTVPQVVSLSEVVLCRCVALVACLAIPAQS